MLEKTRNNNLKAIRWLFECTRLATSACWQMTNGPKLSVSGIANITFCIDTGARCNILTLMDFQRLPLNNELHKSNRTLRTYSNHIIWPVASTDVSLEFERRSVIASCELVSLDQENVISGETAENLGLITQLSSLIGFQSVDDESVPPEL